MSIEGLKLSHDKGVYDLHVDNQDVPMWFRDYLGECLEKQNIQYSHQNKGNIYSLHADKVEFLDKHIAREDYLEYEDCIALLDACSFAMDFLMNKQLMFANMDLGDFLKIDDSFVFVNFHKVFPLKDGSIIETRDISLHKFTPPELEVVGGDVDISSTYYNIASILAYVCCEVYVSDNGTEKIQKQLDAIYYTKLYWFLMRCLEPEPSLRRYLFV
jgi:hypothetical protein